MGVFYVFSDDIVKNMQSQNSLQIIPTWKPDDAPTHSRWPGVQPHVYPAERVTATNNNVAAFIAYIRFHPMGDPINC